NGPPLWYQIRIVRMYGRASAEAVPAWWRRGACASYVCAMKGLVLAALRLAGCRPADGGSQNAPGSAPSKDTPVARAASDSARVNALLERADAGRIQGAKA